jgi:predicted nucleic acid-binding protein
MEGRAVRVVLDANLAVALFLPLSYSAQAREHIAVWDRQGLELLAPTLFEYEINSALHRAAAIGLMTHREARMAMQEAQALAIHCVSPSPELHELAMHWAQRLNHHKSYDAQYVALAEQERADFWTADQRLVSRVRRSGVGWVHWIGEGVPDGL